MKYRKKPLEVEAIQYKKDNIGEIAQFLGTNFYSVTHNEVHYANDLSGSYLSTKIGDWVVLGDQKGDFYPVESNVFDRTYEPIGEVTPTAAQTKKPNTE